MPKKIAIDWDENELRLVAANCSGASVKVTDAAVIPIEGSDVLETLRTAISRRGLESTETLVAIGRGKAELRELQLPPVPNDELPEMVRFQAIRSFASAGDQATVDYLVTSRDDRGVEMIAAAVGPDSLAEIRETCESADLTIKRIGLRPLAAAALYLTQKDQGLDGDTVLIDLLSDDAEIVVAREGRVIFVRTVRMPSVAAARPKALAGELRRSLVACGSDGPVDRVILWGLESVHRDDVDMLSEASGSRVDVLDPFDLVDIDRKLRGELPEHVGRLAPLVGLIASDDVHADRLIDFLNPRKRAEEVVNPYKRALMIGAPVAAALLLAFFGYRHLKNLDAEVTSLKNANAQMKPKVDDAVKKIAKTELVDEFLDLDVNWLSELRRVAVKMPPSHQMIVRGISATGDLRKGGGTLSISGSVTDPDVIELLETDLRDENHTVVGDGSSVQKDAKDDYRWTANELITVSAKSVRNARYEAFALLAENEAEEEPAADAETAEEPAITDESTPESATNPPPAEDPPPDQDPPAEEDAEEDSPQAKPQEPEGLAADPTEEVQS